MTNKEAYQSFVQSNIVSVYNQPWWLDAICGPENWDVWLYRRGDEVLAAMPYYMEQRGNYRYITKAPLTQNNGIVFRHDAGAKLQKQASFEEKVIDSAVSWLKQQDLDVYEQQYSHTFTNWQPFFWNRFKCILRYTYVIEDTSDLKAVRERYSAKLRNDMKKGMQHAAAVEALDPDTFYREHEKIYIKQGLSCPFSYELWMRLYQACTENNSATALCVRNHAGEISSLAFFVWDAQYVYLLMGGAIPSHSAENTFSYLVHKGIELASGKNLGFDFEGSMIKRIAKAFRDFGGVPMPYYRIRKIYNPEIIRKEAEQEILELERS